MSVLYRPSMFILSFLPLWVCILLEEIFSILNDEKCIVTEISVIVMILVGVIGSLIVIAWQMKWSRRNIKHKEYVLVAAKQNEVFTAEYLIAYVIPLFTFDFSKWQQVVLFLVYFITLSFLCIKHGRVYANIVLELRGYNFYEGILQNADLKTHKEIIISKKNLENISNSDIKVRHLGQGYCLDVTST